MSSRQVEITLNGQAVSATEGQALIEVVRGAGVELFTLCYHPALRPYGACRLCLVEATVGEHTGLVAACSTPVVADMVVRTDTTDVIHTRRTSMQMILARCPDVKSLWEFAARMGVTDTPFHLMDDDCIQCGLCERVCRELIGRAAIAFEGRGSERKVLSPFDVESDDCIGCEACVHVCPTGKVKSHRADGDLVLDTWKTHLTVAPCDLCGQPLAPQRLVEHTIALIDQGSTVVSDSSMRESTASLQEHLCPACRRHTSAKHYVRATRSTPASLPGQNKLSISSSLKERKS